MNNTSSNQVSAIRTTITLCSSTEGTTATAPISAFAGILATAENKLILIDNFDIIATGNTKGVTLDTKAIRKTVETIAFKCSSAVIAFASQSPVNNTLISLVDYSQSDLKGATKKDIVSIATAIQKAASNNSGALHFGITATDITDLAAAITLYTTDSSDPRQALLNISNAKRQIKVLIKEISHDIFKMQMDKMVNTLLATNPQFVEKYFQAREIIDLGKTHTKMTGTTHDADGLMLKGVLILLTQIADPSITYKFFSNDLGKFSQTLIKPGEYNIRVELPLYTIITETNIKFVAGKNLKRKYTLILI